MNTRCESVIFVGLALALACAACKPISRPGGNIRGYQDAGPDASGRPVADGGDDASAAEPPRDERCDENGELRCTGAARQRERCEDGAWKKTDACAEAEVCAATAPMPGQCMAVIDICRGSGAATVCDGAGVMYRCGDSGVLDSMERCPSARHCQVGLAARSCATCLPGELRCNGDALETCDETGKAFAMTEACSAGACDAKAGMCRGGPCPDKRAICEDGVLKVCEKGATSFIEVARCGAGLCNAAAARCDACLPGTRTCKGDIAVVCAEQGEIERRNCAEDQVHCVGAGQCVECGRDADCPVLGACQNAYCDLVRGVCESQPRAQNSPCPQGICNADGACVACISDADCPETGPCETRSCDRATNTCVPKPAAEGKSCGAGVCDGKGKCVGCVDDDACPAVGECQTKHCDPASKTCDPQPAPNDEACRGSFGEGSCENGRCVECRGDEDCAGAGACEQAFCRSSDNTCQRRPAPAGAACSGGNVCDGAGDCVACSADLHCGANSSCVNNACVCDPGYVANPNGRGCNFDECSKPDDNHCGAIGETGNACQNTVDGYDCACRAPWKAGADQCFQGGTASDVVTVPNGASWNVTNGFEIVCQNVFENCPSPGQLTWLNLCGLPDTNAVDCSSIGAATSGLGVANIKRISHSGPLQNYGEPNGPGTERVLLPAVGDVFVVQSLATVYLMRILEISAESMRYEWASVWRDACWRPGGPTCTSACSCPGGN